MASVWDEIRKDFPITETGVYLDHAAGGPVAAPVLERVQSFYRENANEADFAWMKWMDRLEKTRRSVASFIHAEPDEITFVQSTSQGMNRVADLISSEGRVLTNSDEFPSGTLPWLWRKNDVLFQQSEDSRISLQKLKSLLSPDIKTILTSYVQYATGFRQNLEALGKLKGERFLVVNGSQGLGHLPVDVKKWDADFFCSNSYKWLMAGYGSGVLYIKKKWLEKFSPGEVGWRSVTVPEKMDNRTIDLKTDAGRYELGCPDFAGIFAVGAAVNYFSSIGPEKIEKRILELRDYGAAQLEKAGFQIVSPSGETEKSGILIIRIEGAQLLFKKLLERNIFVTARGEGLRLAPHCYNNFQDIDVFVKNLLELK